VSEINATAFIRQTTGIIFHFLNSSEVRRLANDLITHRWLRLVERYDYTYTYIYTHTHTHTYIHTYTDTTSSIKFSKVHAWTVYKRE
jgi:hypothetical protein